MNYDLHAIKCLLPEYLRVIGCELYFRGEDHFETACPIHRGKKRNFHADRQPDGTWLWHCFSGCRGDGGTTIDLHARLNGMNPRGSNCIAGAAEALGIAHGCSDKTSRTNPQLNHRRRQDRLEKENSEALTQYLNQSLAQILDHFSHHPWFADWRSALDAGTLVQLEDRRHDSRLFIDALFHPDDILWMGETYDSGHPRNRSNFRPCSDWRSNDSRPPRLAGGIFTAGSISRSAENVEKSPFIVIESDDLIGHEPRNAEEREANKALSFALFFYCQEVLNLHPRAVIDTGNKSLHLWFDRPHPDELAALLELAAGLRIDKGLLKSCHFSPLRIPGTIHEKTGQPASLYFINPIHPHYS